jgi:hypothetical protein
MLTNEEKKIFVDKKREQPPPKGQQPMVNLQVYQPPRPKPQKPDPRTYGSFYMPNPFNPAQFSSYMQYAYKPPPIIKEYNINIDGLHGNHLKAGMIYEDVLPNNVSLGTANTLGERITIYDFVRSIMFSKGDGDDINVDRDGHDSILSHLKFMDLNPYNSYKFSLNPYKGLPYGFLLYRSCYPIRQNFNYKEDIVCARNSTGMNVRVYMMKDGAYMIGRLSSKHKHFTDFDVWREMTFYEYIRERIVKKKISPNFTVMYGYHIPTKCGINFNDIENVKDIKKEYQSMVPHDDKHDVNDRNIPIMEDAAELARLRKAGEPIPQKVIVVETNKGKPTKAIPMAADPNKYTGKAVIALTEAPNYSLYGWASTIYSREGNIKRMKNTGYHSVDVWKGVLFQLMTALYVMQIHGIVIENFSLDNNVFIKDLSMNGRVTSYWKYIIDGIEYYVPNNGYLVLIDSNYRDREFNNKNKFLIEEKNMGQKKEPLVIKKKELFELEENINDEQDEINVDRADEEMKLKGVIFDDVDDNYTKDKVKKEVFEIFKSVMSTNAFGQDFKDHGGCNLPDGVTSLLSNIQSECNGDTDYDIGKYIFTHMHMFMNNRIGTYLKESETKNVRRGVTADFKKGQICVYTDEFGSERFCVFVGNAPAAAPAVPAVGTHTVLTRDAHDSKDITHVDVPRGNVFGYTKVEPIVQNFKPNESNLNEEDLLETYIINRGD